MKSSKFLVITALALELLMGSSATSGNAHAAGSLRAPINGKIGPPIVIKSDETSRRGDRRIADNGKPAAPHSPVAAPILKCGDLKKLQLKNVTRIQAESISSGEFSWLGEGKPPEGGPLPEFCRVQLTVAPKINIEVWLPQNGWNGRYRSEGGGGFSGVIYYGDMFAALRSGYAVAGTDSGHSSVAENPMLDGSFALDAKGKINQQQIEDFAYRSLLELTLKGKAITTAFYGRKPRFNYWHGCSTGGRQGMVAAQRFPDEYDGILAGCPAINWDRLHVAQLWPQVVMQQELGGKIAAEKLSFATQAAINTCDSLDGVVDGIIDDPRACRFDPASLICSLADKSDTCLTAKEAEALTKIWDGPRSKKTGERLWFGTEKGAVSEHWNATPFPIATDYLKYWMDQNANADWKNVTEDNFEDYMDASVAKFREVIGTDEPGLSRFRASGGKLLLWHGESDPAIFSRGTLNYYHRVIAVNGGVDAVSDSLRLFMMPGVRHCGALNAPFPDELFDALVAWVERGLAPDRVIAAQKLESGAIRTRPLCPFPKLARWSGAGSSDDASNFTCLDINPDPDDFRTKYD